MKITFTKDMKIFFMILGFLLAIPVIGYISLLFGLLSVHFLCKNFGIICSEGSGGHPYDGVFVLGYFLVFMIIFSWFFFKKLRKICKK